MPDPSLNKWMQILKLIVKTYLPQWKPTPEGVPVLCPCALSEADRSDLPPRLAVAGPAGRKENGLTLLLADVYYIKSIRPPGEHGRAYLRAQQNRTHNDLAPRE